MKLIKILQVFLVFILIIITGQTVSQASTIQMDDMQPVSIWSLNNASDNTLEIKTNYDGWTLEWSLSGDADDFDPLITGKGTENISAGADAVQLFFQLVSADGDIINMADMMFQSGKQDEENLWEKVIIFWDDTNRSKKTFISGLNRTLIGPSADVPVPGAAWLLGSGFICIAAFRCAPKKTGKGSGRL